MGTYILEVKGDGGRYGSCLLRQDFYSWLIENNISANDIKWEFDEIIKNWDKKGVEINSVYDELSNNEFNGLSLSEESEIEVTDEDTNEVVFSTKLDKKSLEKYHIKSSISYYKTDSYINGTKLIIESGLQGDVYIRYQIETESDFDPSKLILEGYEIDDDVLITHIEYDDSDSDMNHEDSGYDDKGCSPEYVVVENGIEPKKLHSFPDNQCTDWFDIKIKPTRNGFYEVKKCDEQIETVMLKWKVNRFYYEKEEHKFDKKKKEFFVTRYKDVEVSFNDIIYWRGLIYQI